jgi:chromatin remodeling complex protein RSC6
MAASEILEQQFKNVSDELSSISKRTKEIQDNFRILQRTIKSTEKQVKASKKKSQVKLHLSSTLEKFLSVDKGTLLTKAEVMKGVSEYIKSNNLQCEENKRRFVPNKQLSKVFGMNTKESLTFVEINKHVSSHLSKE